jgi:transcriptional regulator with XRE-family HTH domain
MQTNEERQRDALWLRRRLRELGLTQERAAEVADVSARTMRNWLAGVCPIRKPVLAVFQDYES